MSLKANKLIAEATGTFALVFCGCGAAAAASAYGAPDHTGTSLVFGLIVMAMIYSVGNISGAHINPAVTLGFFFAGRLRGGAVIPYAASQIIGAAAAGSLLRGIFGTGTSLGVTLPSGTVLQAFLMETVLSFILMFIILNVSSGHKEKGIMAGVAIGGAVALMALFGGPVSGASMNPARSLGPALASGNLQHLWIYITAPVLGTFLASPTCRWIQGDQCCHVNENGKDAENG